MTLVGGSCGDCVAEEKAPPCFPPSVERDLAYGGHAGGETRTAPPESGAVGVCPL